MTPFFVPHLVQLLLKSPEPPFTNLRKFSYEKLSKWSNGHEIKLNQDPETNEVAKLWPSEKEHKRPLQGVSIESLQHIHLFYSYRNYLIHELREPGYGFEHPEDKEPYYLSVGHSSKKKNGEENDTWELVYPVLFLKELIETSMGNMEKYLIKNKINPYMSYTFGSYWLNELN